MSRLTGNPFQKPSPFYFPRPPLSPPDTNADSVPPSLAPSVAGGVHPAMDMHLADQDSASTETPGARFRRVSSLAYNSSNLRESRERRVHKSFIVVIPPPTFLQEHGQLGHTLAVGPAHRLSQGLLMPLFPTMYGQLTAIAKEFSFPSTTGICLYLQHTSNGVSISPRIADDTWQFLWSHALDSPASGIPICGTIEFEIDFRYARWYTSWLSSAHQREHPDIPVSLAPSTAPSVSHYRAESRVFGDETTADDSGYEQLAPPPPTIIPTSRHVPKKLSLVDRLDTISLRSGSRLSSRQTLSPPDRSENTARVLSPVFQEDEPPTARLDNLESRVNTWRKNSTTIPPTSLAAKGQISLEPANMPNSISLEENPILATVEDEVEGELNLEDYAWSISSAGPGDYEPVSPSSWHGVYSVHMANRMESSVCLTPSDCTSFGPSDYTLSSPALAEFTRYSERAPSPDLAQRMYEDVPPSPTTATSWGPASVACSLCSEEYPLSVDLCDRLAFSRPATPSTATTWGAPLSFPPSPTTPYYVMTPDAGSRGFFDSEDILPPWGEGPVADGPTPWKHVFHYINLEKATEPEVEDPRHDRPWRFTWPYSSIEKATPATSSQNAAATWAHVWPYFSTENSMKTSPVSILSAGHAPWNQVWPYRKAMPPPALQGVSHAPWKQVWPYRKELSRSRIRLVHSVDHSPWKKVWPYHRTPAFPPPVSWKEVLPSDNGPSRTMAAACPAYPMLVIYAPVYPNFNLYPAPAGGSTPKPSARKQTAAYPALIIYAPVYPHFDLYPAPAGGSKFSRVSRQLITAGDSRGYPTLVIYAPVYPYFDLYPAPAGGAPAPKKRRLATTNQSKSLTFKAAYPALVIYPHFDLYPAAAAHVRTAQRMNSAFVQTSYPSLTIYPPVYPYFRLYPAPAAEMRNEITTATRSQHMVSTFSYPSVVLYAAIYPHFDIYPAPAGQMGESLQRAPVSIRAPLAYPSLLIYPASYPYNLEEIYPKVDLTPPRKSGQRILIPPVTVKLRPHYPVFDLYPSGYPYSLNWIYPPVSIADAPKALSYGVYPFICLYASIYPNFSLYPPKAASMKAANSRGRAGKTHHELHLAVYAGTMKPRGRVGRKTHHELHMAVFPGVVSTPTGEQSSAPSPPVSRRPSTTRARSGSVLRSSLAAFPQPPTNTPIVRHSLRPQLPILTLEDALTSPPSSLRRSQSSAISSASARLHSAALSPVKERPGLNRASSVTTPTRDNRSPDDAKSHSASGRWKRDSVVMQRIKAFNATAQDQLAEPSPHRSSPRVPTTMNGM